MCGIFGCLGGQNLITQTLQGLRLLEYRGYDSAGIVYRTSAHKLRVIKALGDIDCLTNQIKTRPDTQLCLGHTRWATNGGVTLKNAHPQVSFNKQIAVVHNGIIENYATCRTQLMEKQINLKTDVDTEVIPNILYLLKHNKHNIHNFLHGQYVFAATDITAAPGFFVAKRGTLPLHIGKATDTIYLSSDLLAFPPTVQSLITLNDGDTGEITTNAIKFYHLGKPITKTWQPFTAFSEQTDKNGFNTYMAKEIHEIPTVIERLVTDYQQDNDLLLRQREFHHLLSKADCVHLCACGTSYHAALILAHLIEKHLHQRAIAHVSSEFTADSLIDEQNLAIVISQSGETADTLTCISTLQAHHVPIVALCNVTSSSIAQQSQLCFPLLCGPEIAVASTKVFCAALLVGCLLINRFDPADFTALSALARTTLRDARQLIKLPATRPQKIFFIGKQIDYFLALESALKVKEVTYTHCEGYPANELKHGPLSLVDSHSLAVVYQGNHTDNAVAEITARGGQVINLPPLTPDNPLSFIVRIIPAQIMALDMAEQLGINPDKPRNLAKSVTVL